MNYDFLTLEDYNTILLNYRDVFYQEFIVDFSTFDLSMGESVVIDDWVEVTRSIDYYSVVVENSLFTGAFSVTGATEDTTQRQYNKDGYLRLILTNVSENTRIRLQLCDLQFNNRDYSDVKANLLQVTPIPSFVVYPYKQTLSFYVTDANGEPVNGYVEEVVGGNSSDIIDGECSITVNAKNKDRLLLCFGDDDHIHCYVPIHCLNNIVGLTFIDPLYNVLYRSTMAEVGFYHKPLNNPEYKLYYNNRLLASSTGGVNSDHIVFTGIDARYLTDEDNIDLTFDINGNRETFNVLVETMHGNWEYLSQVHQDVDVFNLTEDEYAHIRLDRRNATDLLQVYNKVGELTNLPTLRIGEESIIEFNDFIFKDITMNISQWYIRKESVITFNNAVFENINMVYILFNVDSDSLLRFNNCTFKNCTGIFFMGQVEFNYCTFIQTSHNREVFFDYFSNYRFDTCSFTYDYTVDINMNDWGILDITYCTVNGKSYINENFFINNTSSINIRFRDKHVTGTNGFIYKKNGTTYTYNLNVEDIV